MDLPDEVNRSDRIWFKSVIDSRGGDHQIRVVDLHGGKHKMSSHWSVVNLSGKPLVTSLFQIQGLSVLTSVLWMIRTRLNLGFWSLGLGIAEK